MSKIKIIIIKKNISNKNIQNMAQYIFDNGKNTNYKLALHD